MAVQNKNQELADYLKALEPEDWHNAVSYTHLDVYKRQEQLPERGHRNSIGDASDVGAALSKLQALSLIHI